MPKDHEDEIIQDAMEFPDTLQFGKPVIAPYVLLFADLHLEEEPQPTLWWRERGTTRESTVPEIVAVDKCLTAFLKLHKASDQKILDFAHRWGILGLWPIMKEDPEPEQEEVDALVVSWLTYPQDRQWYGETTEFWRRVAKRARALLLIAASLHSNNLPQDQHWEVVLGSSELSKYKKQWLTTSVSSWDRTAMSEIDAQRRTFLHHVSFWTENVPLFLRIDWKNETTNMGDGRRSDWGFGENSGDTPILTLNMNAMPVEWKPKNYVDSTEQKWQERHLGSDMTYWSGPPYTPMRSSCLFNILVVQLVAALTSPKGIYICDVCGNPFVPENKPQRQRHVLCSNPECARQRATERNRDYRARKQASDER